jgi:hypothetical protein
MRRGSHHEQQVAKTEMGSVDLSENFGEPQCAGRAAMPCIGRHVGIKACKPRERIEVIGQNFDELRRSRSRKRGNPLSVLRAIDALLSDQPKPKGLLPLPES